ncbi:MAG: formylmethanofuran dehydrogenase subunit C [Synergistales bacterium]|nr:formylmethanofuran dehydrogenase subunit C [Synergistales bacterium]
MTTSSVMEGHCLDELMEEGVILESLKEDSLPVEAPCLRPGTILGREPGEIAALPLQVGNRRRRLDELFRITVKGDRALVLRGNLKQIKRIGEQMEGGTLIVQGDPGMHLGERMEGGAIYVEGNLPDWCCCGMRDGAVRVAGNAGNMLAGALPGESRGMRGGTVVVMGDTGIRTGEAQRRGLIAVAGNVGAFAGARMVAGTIAVCGRLGTRAGGGMKRGTILALGGVEAMLPTFTRACRYRSPFVELYLRHLQQLGLPVDAPSAGGAFVRWTGDSTTIGKGEILVYEHHAE